MASKKEGKKLGVNRQCAELPTGSELTDLVRREIILDFTIYDPSRNRVDICTVIEREHGTIKGLGNNEFDDTDENMRVYGATYTSPKSTSTADPVKGLIPPILYSVKTYQLVKGGSSISDIQGYKEIRRSLEELSVYYDSHEFSVVDLYNQYKLYYERNRQDSFCNNDLLAAYKITKMWYNKEKTNIENESTAAKMLFVAGMLGVSPKEIFNRTPNDRLISKLLRDIDDSLEDLVNTQKGSDAIRLAREQGYMQDVESRTNNLDDYYKHASSYPKTKDEVAPDDE